MGGESPRSPDAERASFEFADPGIRAELVAAEPAVTSPVAMAWDAEGRLYVAEMNDYPTASEGGRIRRLVDADGDGRYETSMVFADGLHFPASVQPWRDGVLVAAAPDILFFRDTDGDGRADERRIVFSGFGEGNQQLRVNALTWGLDNWVYGANGRSDGELRGGGLTVPVSLRRHDFRFQPDRGIAELLAGPSQFGLGFDAAGNRFLSWNTVPLRHEVIEERWFTGAPVVAGTESLQPCLDPADDGRVFPVAPAPQTFNRESTTHFNALAGLHVFGGDALGAEYVGSAFMGETLRSLIHRRRLEPAGVTFVARRGAREQGREFLAARDPWFHPVFLTTGPDGALYVADFYRRWVEHPGFVPEQLRARFDWREGAEHGRIWRITGATPGVGAARPTWPGRLASADLVGELGHPNAWRRLTAQRLLFERKDPAVVPSLRRAVRRNGTEHALGRLHALWALAGLGAVDESLLAARMRDADPRVRRAALRVGGLRGAAGMSGEGASSAWAVRLGAHWGRLADDPEATVRLAGVLASGEMPAVERLRFLERIVRRDTSDPWLTRAVLLVAGERAPDLAAALLRKPLPNGTEFLSRLGQILGAGVPSGSLAFDRIWVAELRGDGAGAEWGLLAGVAAGMKLAGRDPHGLRAVIEGAPGRPALWERLVAGAKAAVDDDAIAEEVRVRALEFVFLSGSAGDPAGYRRLLEPRHPVAVQTAAAEQLLAANSIDLMNALLAQWGEYAPATRRRIVAGGVRHPESSLVLLRALEQGRIARVEVDPASRDVLLRHSDLSVRERAKAVLASSVDGDRAAVIQRYGGALSVRGDAGRGAIVFAKNCVVCHRVGRVGGQVGPDLAGIGSRPPEALLVDVLDPSRQVAPDYLAYTLVTKDGENPTGLIVAENPASVTLRRANLPDLVVPRAGIVSIRAEGRSLMPDGLEAAIAPAEFSDLLAYLADPDPALLPASP